MHVNISSDVSEYYPQFITSLPVPYFTVQLKHTNTEYLIEMYMYMYMFVNNSSGSMYITIPVPDLILPL